MSNIIPVFCLLKLIKVINLVYAFTVQDFLGHICYSFSLFFFLSFLLQDKKQNSRNKYTDNQKGTEQEQIT